jgi:hypothetical protein
MKTTEGQPLRIDWIWWADNVGWFVSVNGHAYGPMKFADIARLPKWVLNQALHERDYDERMRLCNLHKEIEGLGRKEWDQLIADAEMCTMGNTLNYWVGMRSKTPKR